MPSLEKCLLASFSCCPLSTGPGLPGSIMPPGPYQSALYIASYPSAAYLSVVCPFDSSITLCLLSGAAAFLFVCAGKPRPSRPAFAWQNFRTVNLLYFLHKISLAHILKFEKGIGDSFRHFFPFSLRSASHSAKGPLAAAVLQQLR